MCVSEHRRPTVLAVRVIAVETVESDRQRLFVRLAFNSPYMST